MARPLRSSHLPIAQELKKPLSPNRKSILILGNFRPALTIGRLLAARDLHVIIDRDSDSWCVEWSRHVDEVWDHPTIESDGLMHERDLKKFLAARPDVKMLFPVSEKALAVVSNVRQELPPDLHVVMATTRAVNLCRDKPAMYRLATSCGVPHEQFIVTTNLEELYDSAEQLGFPLIARPLEDLKWLGTRKAIICASSTELRQNIPDWPAGHKRILAQRYSNGKRHNVYFAAHRGKMLGNMQVKVLRTDRADGTGLAVEGVTVKAHPLLTDYCGRLIRALDYTGVGCAQFLLDADTGRARFLEINPRLGANYAIVESSGLPLTDLAINLSSNEYTPDDKISISYPPGQRYTWLYGDVAGFKASLLNGDLDAFGAVRWLFASLLANLRSDAHITWRWRDPLPTLALFARRFQPRWIPRISMQKPAYSLARENPPSG